MRVHSCAQVRSARGAQESFGSCKAIGIETGGIGRTASGVRGNWGPPSLAGGTIASIGATQSCGGSPRGQILEEQGSTTGARFSLAGSPPELVGHMVLLRPCHLSLLFLFSCPLHTTMPARCGTAASLLPWPWQTMLAQPHTKTPFLAAPLLREDCRKRRDFVARETAPSRCPRGRRRESIQLSLKGLWPAATQQRHSATAFKLILGLAQWRGHSTRQSFSKSNAHINS